MTKKNNDTLIQKIFGKNEKIKYIFKEENEKIGNCAVEAIDLGRIEERTKDSNEGDKRGALLPPTFSLSLSLCLFMPLSLSLSLFRESSTWENFDSPRGSYSPLNRSSSHRALVAPSSFIFQAKTRRKEFHSPAGSSNPATSIALRIPSFSFSILLPQLFSSDVITTLFFPFPLVNHLYLTYLYTYILFSSSFFLRNFLVSHSSLSLSLSRPCSPSFFLFSTCIPRAKDRCGSFLFLLQY